MKTMTDIASIMKEYLLGPQIAVFDYQLQKAEQGGDEEKFAFGRFVREIVERSSGAMPVTFEPEDTVALQGLLLKHDEELAERGHVTAMRYAACDYANGYNHREVHKTENGWRISAAPDFAKAVDWARKAEAAGDAVAAKIRPSLERDLAESLQPKPPA